MEFRVECDTTSVEPDQECRVDAVVRNHYGSGNIIPFSFHVTREQAKKLINDLHDYFTFTNDDLNLASAQHRLEKYVDAATRTGMYDHD